MKFPRSIRTNMLFFLVVLSTLFALVAAVGVIGIKRVSSSANLMYTKYIPLIESVHSAHEALLKGQLLIDAVILNVKSPRDFDDVRKYQSRFQQQMIAFDMYSKAVLLGSESEEFKKSSGGLTQAEWERKGLKGKLIVKQAPDDIRQLVHEADAHFTKFCNNALKAMKCYKKALRLELSERMEEAAVERKKVQDYKHKTIQEGKTIEDVYKKIIDSVGVYSSNAHDGIINTSNIVRVTVIGLSAFLFICVAAFTIIFSERLIISPIKQLVEKTKAIGKGELDTKIEIKRGGELGQLANAFSNMVADLQKTTVSRDSLIESEQQIRTIINSALDAVILMNQDGLVINWNPQAEEIFGWSYEEAVNQKLSELIIPERYREAHEKGLKHFLKTGEGHVINKRIEIEGLKQDGSEIPIELGISLISKGNTKLFSAFVIDISERKQYEKELKKEKERAEVAANAKSDFLANMSHEIRTPMNSILGFTDLLNKTELNDIQKKYLKTIQSGGQLLLGIIDDILNFSKLEAGKVKLESIDFEIQHLIRDAFHVVLLKTKDKRLDTYMDVASNVPTVVKGDPTRLSQIFINLLGNAMKFTSEGEIGILANLEQEDISLNEDEIGLRFCVKDSGIGIPKEQQKDIFQAFTQADATTTRKFGGSGLGLAISKSLIETMGGKIWIESEEGKGSEFFFIVKFKKSKVVVKKNSLTRAREQLKGRRVLIVDDNAMARKILTHGLNFIEMNVISAEKSGLSALQKLDSMQQKDLPELILSDIHMEEMNGYEFAREIKANEKYKDIKVLAITGDLEAELSDTAKTRSFDGYLLKPVAHNDMIRDIAKVLLYRWKEDPDKKSQETTELSCKGIKVLVAEDSPPNLMLIQVYFDDLGCEGEYVNNGQEAIDKLREGNKYDLCLMDLQMPVCGGIEATKIIREEINKDIPIIALTAAVMEEDRMNAEGAGMNDYLTKPIDIVKLKEKILEYGRRK